MVYLPPYAENTELHSDIETLTGVIHDLFVIFQTLFCFFIATSSHVLMGDMAQNN
jgi:hypothetical protein